MHIIWHHTLVGQQAYIVTANIDVDVVSTCTGTTDWSAIVLASDICDGSQSLAHRFVERPESLCSTHVVFASSHKLHMIYPIVF